MELSPHTGSFRDRVRAAYLRLGLLGWLSLLSALGAFVLQCTLHLPHAYTWLDPLRTLRRVAVDSHFPSAVLVVYGFGVFARRGEWDPTAAARRMNQRLEPSALGALAGRLGAWFFGVLFVDVFVLGASPDLPDILALTALSFLLAHHRHERARLWSGLGYAAWGTLCFALVSYAYTVVKACALFGTRRYDAAIIAFESACFGVAPHRMLAAWATTHPAVVALCDWIYFHFFEHMILVTVLLFALKKRQARSEYLAALALCYLMGGPLYHLFPALGPGYFEPTRFPFLSDPALISSSIRQWLAENTRQVAQGTSPELRTWGYIACMPSLHVAQELVMLYYSRGSRLAFAASFAFTVLTLLSVVVLGWHYPLDALGGALVAAVAVATARWQGHALMPRGLNSVADGVLPRSKPVLVPFIRGYFVARRLRGAVRP